MPSSHLILCHPLLLWPSIFPNIRVFFFKYKCVYFNWRLITVLCWFCHTSTWICRRCTHVPHPELTSHLPPCTFPLGHPSAPAPSILYPASNLDWRFYDIIHGNNELQAFSLVQFSRSVMSDSLRPHELQHTRLPCPSPIPGVHPNPCPLCWWYLPTISSSAVPFSSCPQSFSASRSFPRSQLF